MRRLRLGSCEEVRTRFWASGGAQGLGPAWEAGIPIAKDADISQDLIENKIPLFEPHDVIENK